MLEDINFLSDRLNLFGVLAKPNRNSNVGIIFHHGGGQSNTARYKFLQEKYLKSGITSLAFDFRGCGKSQGEFTDSGLINRLTDAQNATKFFYDSTGIPSSKTFLWGSSMGAHIVCRLSEKKDFKGLILQSAAAYSIEAETPRLDQEFSSLIRKPDSWLHSPAFTALKNFTGEVLVIYGADDEVIPQGVKSKYRELSEGKGKFIEINGGTHTLLNPQAPNQQKALEKLAEISQTFILNNN